jgi:hypothetical protein
MLREATSDALHESGSCDQSERSSERDAPTNAKSQPRPLLRNTFSISTKSWEMAEERLLPKKREEMAEEDEYSWVSGRDPNVVTVKPIGSGGSGEVFQVLRSSLQCKRG